MFKISIIKCKFKNNKINFTFFDYLQNIYFIFIVMFVYLFTNLFLNFVLIFKYLFSYYLFLSFFNL